MSRSLRCGSRPQDKYVGRSLAKSIKFYKNMGWMFVGCCKRGWYKTRMHLHFWLAKLAIKN